METFERREAMESNFGEYEAQLQAVEQALNETSNPSEKTELEALKASILELLELTKHSNCVEEFENPENDVENDQQDEMQRFMAEIREIDSTAQIGEPSVEADIQIKNQLMELKADLEKMVGQKCSAPHQHSWGAIAYHNAIVCGVTDSVDINNDGRLEAQMRVLFTNPTHREMLPCTFYLEGECRFDESRCHYSHGEIVALAELREYMEPDFTRLSRNCVVLAKSNDRLWHRGRVLCANFVDKQCRVRLDGTEHTKREQDYNFEDLLPIFHDEDLSSGSSTDESSDTDSEESLDHLEKVRRAALVQQSLFCFKPTQALGEWERHTKGIGSKLMEKMGYIHGTGLGSEGQGIVIPISAQILPQGRSLDYCMGLREAANGDKNLFSVERKLHHAKKKQDAHNLKAYARESERTDVFSFLNENVFASANGKTDDTSDSSKRTNSNLQKQSTMSLNIDSVRIADNIRRKQREILKTKESLRRNSNSAELQKKLQSLLNLQKEELLALEKQETNLTVEQVLRKTKNKFSVF